MTTIQPSQANKQNQRVDAARLLQKAGTLPLAMSPPWKHPSSGVFWLRKGVPEDLRKLVGKREEKRSLQTGSKPANSRSWRSIATSVRTLSLHLQILRVDHSRRLDADKPWKEQCPIGGRIERALHDRLFGRGTDGSGKPAPVNSPKRSSAVKSASAFFASKLCRVLSSGILLQPAN
jgi:Domain of unknown function (DUF6538)